MSQCFHISRNLGHGSCFKANSTSTYSYKVRVNEGGVYYENNNCL